MTTENVKDLLAKIGAIYFGKYFDIKDSNSPNKTLENDPQMNVYHKAYKLLENVCVSLDKEEFAKVGAELRQIQKESGLPMEDIFADLKVVHALLNCVREVDG